MKQFNIIFIFSLLFAVGCGGSATDNGTLIGSVANTSFDPISGASVSVNTVSGTTASNGSYNLSNVKTGLQTITVSASNYISVSKQINISSLDKTYAPIIVLSRKDSKSTDVDSGGGEVTNTDGTVKVTIPDGATKAKETVTITKADISSAPAAPPVGYKFIYLVYISPVDIVLDKKVTLTIPLPTDASSLSSVPFFRYNPTSLSWDSIGIGAVSAADNTISIGISNFGWIAAAASIGIDYGTIIGKVINSSGSILTGASVWNASQYTVADAMGIYSLTNVPSGSTSVYASAIGYNTNSVTVTVTSGKTTNASDIILTSVASIYGSIAGRVTNSATSSPISGAKITAASKTAYTDSSGNYTISNVSPGNINVNVYAYGYAYKNSTVSVTAGNTTTADFALETVAVSNFGDDFETDKGWSISSSYAPSPRPLWHRVLNSTSIKDTLAPSYATLPDYSSNSGAIPSAHSGSYSYWFGEDAKGCYIGDQNTGDISLSGGTSNAIFQGEITSPTISLNGYVDAILTFWTWWEIESVNSAGLFDIMSVQISTDGGGSWNELSKLNPIVEPTGKAANLPYSSGGFNKTGVWVKHQIDLSSYIGKNIQIRFSFNTNDVKYNGFRGWFIDDVDVKPGAM